MSDNLMPVQGQPVPRGRLALQIVSLTEGGLNAAGTPWDPRCGVNCFSEDDD